MLAFQHAKLAFERELIASGIDYAIVRPTAFFKSLSGQIDRLRRGQPFLLFGDGALTACKPISDRDLACYLADCVSDQARRNRILPIGGPGPAITPREQGERLFALLGRYYATESMLVLDPVTGRYDADATPSTGSDTLFDFYARLVDGSTHIERGDHAVF